MKRWIKCIKIGKYKQEKRVEAQIHAKNEEKKHDYKLEAFSLMVRTNKDVLQYPYYSALFRRSQQMPAAVKEK